MTLLKKKKRQIQTPKNNPYLPFYHPIRSALLVLTGCIHTYHGTSKASLLNKEMPEAVISVDTFRADIAKMCVEEHGVAIINDISAGSMDDRMMPVVAKLGVPYIMMHMKGTPQVY